MIRVRTNCINSMNLHLHSNVSDGNYTPHKLITHAEKLGIELISITDHDTLDAYKLFDIGSMQIRIIPGVEISARHHNDEVHLLAYGIDLDNNKLNDFFDCYLVSRRERALEMVEKLRNINIFINFDDIVAVSGSRELIVRPHIAQVLVQSGYCTTKNEAFDRYIGNSAPAYVPKAEFSVLEVVNLVHQANGFVYCAHPGKLKDQLYLSELLEFGIDGVEVWHPDHNQEQYENYIDFAVKHKLMMSAGSDFHGEMDRNNMFNAINVNQAVIDSVNVLWEKYRCHQKQRLNP